MHTFPTEITQVSLLVGVISLVNIEIGGTRESFITESTLVWFNSEVSTHVYHQIIVSHELQPTLATKIWFLVLMSFRHANYSIVLSLDDSAAEQSCESGLKKKLIEQQKNVSLSFNTIIVS